jgi:acetone carboxylase gamma subunit
MTVYQTNVFICEVCGHIESVTCETSMYDDPIVLPKNKWGIIEHDGEEKFVCVECLKLR